MSADKMKQQIIFLHSLGPGDEKYDEIVTAFAKQGEQDPEQCTKMAIQEAVRVNSLPSRDMF